MSSNTASLDGAIHQQLLGAEHLRHLGEQHAAAERRHAIGDAAEQRVRADAAEPVRAAALVAEHEVATRALSSRRSSRMRSTSFATAPVPSSSSSITSCVLKNATRLAIDRRRRGASARRAGCSRSRGRGSARRRRSDGASDRRARAACSLDRRRAGCSHTDARTRARRRSRRRTARPPACAIRSAAWLTQPTVLSTQSSLRVPTRPSARR